VDLFNNYDRIGGVIVSVLASIVVDRRFETRSGQPNDYQIGICCFSAITWYSLLFVLTPSRILQHQLYHVENK
jgi:hypothetical protein